MSNVLAGALEKRFQMVRLVIGKPCTMQGPNSEVLLHVPVVVYGAILANIHTDHAKFLDHIAPDDCVVSPICEYHLQPLIYQNLPVRVTYTLQIPHIIRDVRKVRNKIRIRHINEERATVVTAGDLERYEIDDKYVTIYTTHLCNYIVTAEDINCCNSHANVLLFGALNQAVETKKSRATFKVFFSSNHTGIADYESVSYPLSPYVHIYQIKVSDNLNITLWN